jgi:hypothetical protein
MTSPFQVEEGTNYYDIEDHEKRQNIKEFNSRRAQYSSFLDLKQKSTP